jgi:CPA2 family monovalent cation:H+ antiporter-2
MRARIEAARPPDPDLLVRPPGGRGHAIVIGNGRVGLVVSDLLDRHGLAHVTVDNNPRSVLAERRAGREVYFGNAIDAEFLTQCGLAEARAVIITAALDAAEVEELVRQIRLLRPDVVIVARARDADQARKLYALGVTDAVPETIEASLQLSEAALLGMGLAAGRVIASIHDKRDEFRAALGGEGQGGEGRGRRAVRAKTAAGPKA